jgi:hypothetical protein
MSNPITDHTAGGGGEARAIAAARDEYERWSTAYSSGKPQGQRAWVCRHDDAGQWQPTTYHDSEGEASDACHEQALASAVCAALAAHPTGPGEAEPVAWAFEYRDPVSGWNLIVSTKRPVEADYRRNIRPLYAAPTPPAGDAGAEPEGRDLMVRHPLTGRDAPAWIVLGDMAAQENCDGEPYDTMQAVADVLLTARSSRLTPAEPAVSPAGGEDLEGLSAMDVLDDLLEAHDEFIRDEINDSIKEPDTARFDRAYSAVLALLPAASRPAADKGFAIGQRVRKVSGSSWQGTVVGFYSTDLTPDGICVESEREPGSVQIYPAKALALLDASRGEPEGGR